MAFNINDFRSRLKYDGARNNLFEVQISSPVDGSFVSRSSFFVRSANLPASQIGFINVPYFGRFIKIPGDRVFPDWTVTVINDEDFSLRNSLEKWSNAMSNLRANLRSIQKYTADAIVIQYSKTGAPLRTYKFNNIFPTAISEIPLDWSSTDAIEEFSVTFQYDYWTIDGAGGVGAQFDEGVNSALQTR